MTGMLSHLVATQNPLDREVVVLHADANEAEYAQRENTNNPVSYTHLDVYKRQVFRQ